MRQNRRKNNTDKNVNHTKASCFFKYSGYSYRSYQDRLIFPICLMMLAFISNTSWLIGLAKCLCILSCLRSEMLGNTHGYVSFNHNILSRFFIHGLLGSTVIQQEPMSLNACALLVIKTPVGFENDKSMTYNNNSRPKILCFHNFLRFQAQNFQEVA